ncbi:MAG: PLP-dependent lyase/thiolase, partial [Firmicutes bacterium]|nr:PLP-dependent lyase/thiolase [Bacillota bacterium]
VSETEYTGAGKHIQPQLAFAKENGIDVRFGNPQEEDKPGTNLILPKDPSFIKHKVADLKHFKQSRIKKAVKKAGCEPNEADLVYLAEEVKEDVAFVKETLGL